MGLQSGIKRSSAWSGLGNQQILRSKPWDGLGHGTYGAASHADVLRAYSSAGYDGGTLVAAARKTSMMAPISTIQVPMLTMAKPNAQDFLQVKRSEPGSKNIGYN